MKSTHFASFAWISVKHLPEFAKCACMYVYVCKYVRMCVLASLSYANLIVNSGKNASPEHGEEDRIDRGRETETAGGCGDS